MGAGDNIRGPARVCEEVYKIHKDTLCRNVQQDSRNTSEQAGLLGTLAHSGGPQLPHPLLSKKFCASLTEESMDLFP